MSSVVMLQLAVVSADLGQAFILIAKIVSETASYIATVNNYGRFTI